MERRLVVGLDAERFLDRFDGLRHFLTAVVNGSPGVGIIWRLGVMLFGC